jgi:solute carrier family 35 (UDP-sugar transporter), member A1/2/3
VYRSSIPYLGAVLLHLLGDPMNELQWVTIVLLCIAIMNAQYDETLSGTKMSGSAYAMLALHVCITAASSVWNQKVLQGSRVALHLQNLILYTYGLIFALFSYIFMEEPLHKMSTSAVSVHLPSEPTVQWRQKGFLEGYTPLAILLVLSQAFTGLAIAALIKYADTIVRSFASSVSMALLVLLSGFLFETRLTFHSMTGVVSILVLSYTCRSCRLN